MKKSFTNEEVINGLRNYDPKMQSYVWENYRKTIIHDPLKNMIHASWHDDLLTIIFKIVFTKIDLYNDKWSLYTWIKIIAKRETINFLRKKEQRKWENVREYETNVRDLYFKQNYVETLDNKLLLDSLDILEGSHKEIIHDYYIQGFNERELGIKFNKSACWISLRRKEALAKLRSHLTSLDKDTYK